MIEHCETCKREKELATCYHCAGQGGHHDCGDDTCCCLDRDEITHDCEICDGAGEYLICPHCFPDSFDENP